VRTREDVLRERDIRVRRTRGRVLRERKER
jgi:hypothetical protein